MLNEHFFCVRVRSCSKNKNRCSFEFVRCCSKFVSLRSDTIAVVAPDELTSYIDLNVTLSCSENIDNFDVLSWWLARKNDLPTLFKIFLRNATIQSTSCSSERAFSLSGLIITEKRAQLDSNTVDDIVICRNMH